MQGEPKIIKKPLVPRNGHNSREEIFISLIISAWQEDANELRLDLKHYLKSEAVRIPDSTHKAFSSNLTKKIIKICEIQQETCKLTEQSKTWNSKLKIIEH